MKKIGLNLVVAVMFLFTNACETTQIESEADQEQFLGEWKLVNVFLGDVVDQPCANGTDLKVPITIKFTTEKSATGEKDKLVFSGKSAVNGFFGDISMTGFDINTGRGTIEVGMFATTEMASSADLMACEERFYDILGKAKNYELSKQGDKTVLKLGQLADPSAPPSRAGAGTFLVFEK